MSLTLSDIGTITAILFGIVSIRLSYLANKNAADANKISQEALSQSKSVTETSDTPSFLIRAVSLPCGTQSRLINAMSIHTTLQNAGEDIEIKRIYLKFAGMEEAIYSGAFLKKGDELRLERTLYPMEIEKVVFMAKEHGQCDFSLLIRGVKPITRNSFEKEMRLGNYNIDGLFIKEN